MKVTQRPSLSFLADRRSTQPALLDRRSVLAAGAALAAAPLIAGRFAPAQAKAPLLGSSQPAVYRFKLGDFEITMISDSDAFIDGPYPIIGANASPEEVAALMRDNLLPESKYQPGFTPMVVNTGREILVFDTGNGANGFVPRPQGGWLAAKLATAGFAPETDRHRRAVARPPRPHRRRDGERQAAVSQRQLRDRRRRLRLLGSRR